MNFNIASGFIPKVIPIIEAVNHAIFSIDMYENKVKIAKDQQIKYFNNPTKEKFHEIQGWYSAIVEDIFSELSIIAILLQNEEIKEELEELFEEWMEVINDKMLPLMDRILKIFNEIDEYSNVEKIIRLQVINLELQKFVELLEEYVQVFRLSLLQIIYADQRYSQGLYEDEDINQIEE